MFVLNMLANDLSSFLKKIAKKWNIKRKADCNEPVAVSLSFQFLSTAANEKAA